MIYIFMYIYIYIHREREREGERENMFLFLGTEPPFRRTSFSGFTVEACPNPTKKTPSRNLRQPEEQRVRAQTLVRPKKCERRSRQNDIHNNRQKAIIARGKSRVWVNK